MGVGGAGRVVRFGEQGEGAARKVVKKEVGGRKELAFEVDWEGRAGKGPLGGGVGASLSLSIISSCPCP